jgi:hypothetical protein
MGEAQNIGSNRPVDEGRRASGPQEARPRAVGSPLPTGAGSQAARPDSNGDPQRPLGNPPPGRALSINFAPDPPDGPSAIARALGTLRSALPFVQKILPLLDGNFATAIANVLTPHPHAPPPPPPVNLAPIEDGLMELQTQHKELRDQVAEQNSSLKRVEDQLEMVREATDRNTLEQQELLEDLKGVGKKVNIFALIALGLLAVSLLINIVLYLHIVKVLP